MLNCFAAPATKSIPITFVTPASFSHWLSNQSEFIKQWIKTSGFRPEAGQLRLLPNPSGEVNSVIFCASETNTFWAAGSLPLHLPEGTYHLDVAAEKFVGYATAWGLGAYQFTRYKKAARQPAQLVMPSSELVAQVENIVAAIYLVRDWINTPTDDMGPTEFAAAAEKLAQQYAATFSQIIGEDLLKQNYPCIYTVGRASDDAPRLLDMRWGNPQHPKVTLVGKGVCFDTGGLDIKASSFMLLMKKDMAGGAHAFGLAKMIMQAELPICLRVLVPVVENAISGNAYRPGDVIKSRKGLTIEVGNTDAEGRVILADALTEAASENPELLIDMSTLTGAARVAVGTELAAVFANNDEVVNAVIKQGEQWHDPLWRLPLYAPYRDLINSTIADINNNASEPYAGAITAALFLKEFVPDTIPWLHFDVMAWNTKQRPGRPQGGEAMGIRALFHYLENKYAK